MEAVIWTEKYRPKTLDEIIGHEEIMFYLKHLIESNNLPHLVLYGTKNTGKRSTVIALARALYGGTWENNLAFFDASDFFDRGKRYLVSDPRFAKLIGTDDPKKIRKSVISIFKEVINEYAAMAALDSDFRMIAIDSAEALSPDAQHALRRIMEKYSKTCRFILSTTHLSRLIPPLRSRGLNLFFDRASDEAVAARIRSIASAEGASITDGAGGGVQAIVHYAQGDFARAIMALQIACMQDCEITANTIYEIDLERIPQRVEQLLNASLAGDFKEARKEIDNLLMGESGADIVDQLRKVSDDRGLDDALSVALAILLAEADINLINGSDERVQLEAWASQVGAIVER
ncbi:MAG: AAA family ATPase [Euryarchaeota archaeon]|nr:AAA family ATPase [Euryarchaeota archaeon]